ncbi:BCCT family transporter [Paraurantiacibacter namhicola]|uniref:Glycine betaine transporter OpuD n=1 Tax=Paraurantiacibacter namhicola TaxID=645517 RepID=A0A1C7D4Q7_9SPHN|nr:BCCT family transporter [Paraurantiacibacter namhicola]ANU06447.1 Glycine betaine transporter OpuD [Paraurantiacibacter namhicola]
MGENDQKTIEPPLTELPIAVSEDGFYSGFSKHVALPSKIIVSLLIIWAIAFPLNAGEVLGVANATLIQMFSGWYIWLVGGFLALSVVLALLPVSGRLKLGQADDVPEFSRFSWFAMMFGAGLGIGMLTYSTGEPLAHLQNNPVIIAGEATALTEGAVRSAYLYSFLHWGFSAWAIYALAGLSIGYVAYRRGLPLTIRSGLAPLFGRHLTGLPGHLVDIVAVVATILGISVTLGLGVEQFVHGLHRIGLGEWLLAEDASASTAAIIVALIVIVGASTLSALSGVGRGIKWLSNLNLILSFVLFAAFIVAGSALLSLEIFGRGLFDYIVSLPALSFGGASSDGTSIGDAVAQWQLDWTVFYWAWWIAFAPFVGMFIARVSKGRTVREYILGVVLAPALMCFVWLALIGGTAVDLVLSGAGQGEIIGTVISDQLYATIAALMSPGLAYGFSILVVVLLLTYVITSADSAILVVNTINAGGNSEDHGRRHIIFWGVAIALVVGSLLVVGGLGAIRTAMIIGALPFSFVSALLAIAVVKAIWRDTIRMRHGVDCTSGADGDG